MKKVYIHLFKAFFARAVDAVWYFPSSENNHGLGGLKPILAIANK
ncbi:MAG: hypothetical protein QM687_12605 [Ferruginibacter sp.]